MKKRTKGRIKKFEEKNRMPEPAWEKEEPTPVKRKTKQKSQSSGSRRLITVIAIILIAVLAVSGKNIYDLLQEKKMLEEENEALVLEKESLEDELKNANDAEYIEEQARIQLKLIKPGEILYILEDEKDDSDKEDEKDD